MVLRRLTHNDKKGSITYAYPPPPKCNLNENQALFEIEKDIVIVEKYAFEETLWSWDCRTFGELDLSVGAKSKTVSLVLFFWY